MKRIMIAVCACLLLVLPVVAVAQSVPSLVEQKIKEHYEEKYPGNYSVQETLVRSQLDAYRFMQRWDHEPGVPDDVLRDLKARYAAKYPHNYSMQKTLVQSQIKSYLKLHQ